MTLRFQFQGLIVVQVSQNQAAVICDPQNKVFVIKNGGFAAMSLVGSYSILGVIDQTHLSTVVRDKVTNAILGWTQEVKMSRNTGREGGNKEFVVALFLNIPANNCAILQKGNELIVIPAGQHYIVDPSITLRGMFTFGENQLEMPTKVLSYLWRSLHTLIFPLGYLHARSSAGTTHNLPQMATRRTSQVDNSRLRHCL